uniref:Uncharacterized protein n=1 Tax=Ananas comosus var. bracteatus TaxID=296719 RepID=A0A6V7QIN7_ANACO|nr:unnamed protein product [Ananas comosus var. bracteatus]
MKLDTTALDSAAALIPSIGGDGVFAAPSFDLPSCDDFDGFQKNAKETLKHAKGRRRSPSSSRRASSSPRILGLAWEDTYPLKASRKSLRSILTCLEQWLEELLIANFGIGTWESSAVYMNWRTSEGSRLQALQSCWQIFSFHIEGWASQLVP